MIERRHEALRCTTVAAAMGLLFVVAPDVRAQSVAYTRGEALWNNPSLGGIAGGTQCSACHTIADRRARIAANGGLTVPNARIRFDAAIAANQGGVMSQYNAFSNTDKDSMASYLANFRGFGSISPGTALTFNASPSTQRVTLTNSGSAMLTILLNNGVVLEGANLVDFRVVDVPPGCQGRTLNTNISCSVDVTFMTSASGTRVAELVFNHDGNPSINRVGLTGTASGSPPPPPPPPPSGGGGGGATEPTTLWSLLALAALLVRRRLLHQ